MTSYNWQGDDVLNQTADLDRSIALGIRKSPSELANSPRPNTAEKSSTPKDLSNMHLRSREEIIKNTSQRPSSEQTAGPPPIINIFAENYRFKLAERIAGSSAIPRAVSEPRKRITPILIPYQPDNPRPPQTERKVHFFPEKDDVVPKHAQIFDIDQAIFEFNERIAERQQYALFHAQMLCDPPTPKQQQQRFSTAQRCLLRNMYGDPRPSSGQISPQYSGQNSRSYVPPRQKKSPPSKHRPNTAETFTDNLTDTLTISKVALPSSPRRPASQKNPPGALRANGNARRPSGKTSPKPQKRYRSPPPRAFRQASKPGSAQGRPIVKNARPEGF